MNRKSTETKTRATRDVKFSVKAVDDEQGVIEGYASVFGNVDWYNDVVDKGAFKRTLNNGKNIPILWQHNADFPIGVTTEAREDARGLYVKGKLVLESEKGREAYALIKAGAIKGLSIGYDTIEYTWNEEDQIRHLTEVRLWEWSPVTFPANEEAEITGVKKQPEDTPVPTLDTKLLADAVNECIETAMESMRSSLVAAIAGIDVGALAKDMPPLDATDTADAVDDPPKGTQPPASSTDASDSGDHSEDEKSLDITMPTPPTIEHLPIDDAAELLHIMTISEEDIAGGLTKDALSFSPFDVKGVSEISMDDAERMLDAMAIDTKDFIDLCDTDSKGLLIAMNELDIVLKHADESMRLAEVMKINLTL